jgi:NIPSNAP protein
MIQRFRTFSALFAIGVLAMPLVGSAQAPPAPAAPATPARGPAAPTPPCGPGVTGKNIASDSRCFELRTYTVRAEGPGSIDLLHSRFRDHTNRLFRKHGMTIVGFWQPLSADKERTLIYLLAYKDGAARDAAWNGFRNDPEWKDVTSKMQVGTQVESVFMNSTDYGPMK